MAGDSRVGVHAHLIEPVKSEFEFPRFGTDFEQVVSQVVTQGPNRVVLPTNVLSGRLVIEKPRCDLSGVDEHSDFLR